MKDLVLIVKSAFNKRSASVIFCLAFILFFASLVQAQPFPFTQRKTWDGPYDIKMIAAPNLDPVFVNPGAGGSNLLADSLIRYDVIQRTGDLLHINNQYKGGSPFNTVNIPKSAFLCGDPDVGGCIQGLLTQNTNSSCPVKRYNGPDYASMKVSMSYADYDADMTTYSSSMAQLDISSCSEIEAAYLYWAGDWKGSNPNITLMDGPLNTFNGVNASTVFNASTSSGYQTIKFKIPGGAYQNVTATTAYAGTTAYVCVADVTTLVQGTGGGQFWAANIQSYPNEGNGGSTSGWSLVVVFRSPLSPPRLIYLWDGLINISSGGSTNLVLTGLTTPSTSNFKSYVGIGVLDGENLAVELGGSGQEGLGFQTNNGGSLFNINPFATDQPPYRMYNKKGYPSDCGGSDDIDGCKKPLYSAAWCSSYDGISSSHITTYNEITDKNGDEITRLPSNKNTLGFDAHHLKLPNGSVTPGATQATLTVRAGPQGGTSPFLAYIAIERLQPKLTMSKSVNLSSTSLGTQLDYTIRVKNEGNTSSLGGDVIYDSLDVATNYTPGSFASTRYVGGAAAGSGAAFSQNLDSLQFTINNPIGINDSVVITFKVDITANGSASIFSPPICKRTIENSATIIYNVMNAPFILTARANSDECGTGPETRTLLIDASLGTPNIIPMGPFTGCGLQTTTVYTTIQQKLISAGYASTATLSEFDIRDGSNNRVQMSDVFGTVSGSVTYYAYHNNSASAACQDRYDLVFNCPPPCPTGAISGSTSICNDGSSTATISVALGGTAPFTFVYAIDGVNQAPITTSLATYTFASALADANHTYTLVSLDDAIFSGASSCGILSGSAVITSKPVPAVTSAAANTTYCSGTAQSYAITSSIGSTTYSWSRAGVTNINGGVGVTGQTANPITETLTNATAAAIAVTYVITPTSAGCTGTPFNYDVTVNPKPVVNSAATGTICSGIAQNYDITSNVGTATFSWSRAVVTGISNAVATAQTADPIVETLTNTTTTSKTVTYVITPTAAGCAGTNFNYVVTVNPTPVVTSAATGSVCSGAAQNYDITSGVASTTYSWDRAGVANINGGAGVTGQTADPIIEVLTNSTAASIVVNYLITPTAAGCAGTPFNYDVTVNPIPVVNSAATGSVCSAVAQNYDITSNVATATFSWSRAGVTNINGGVGATGQTSDPIVEVLNNATSSPIVVNYKITPSSGGCAGTIFNYDVTVNPTPVITSVLTGSVCSGVAQNYDITSNIGAATFTWDRAGVANINGGTGVTGQTSDPITETLTNSTTSAIQVTYVITPVAATSCPGIASNYVVTVNPIPVVTSAASGSICSGTAHTYDITSDVASATFSWSRAGVANINGGAGLTGQTADPITETLTNTTTGALVVTYAITPTFAGCPGTPFNYDLIVNPNTIITTQPASADLCAGDPLNLTVASTGLAANYQWLKNGSPVGTNSATYSVASSTVADAGSYTVVLTNACSATSNAAVITVTTPPVNTLAVSDDQICQGTNGTVIISGSELGKTYEAFIGATSVSTVGAGNGGNLTLSVNASALVVGPNTVTINAYGCNNTVLTDQATITVTAIPVASAGSDIQIDDYATITLDGSASSSGAGYSYLWTSNPAASIANPAAITTTADVNSINTQFTLTVTDLANPSCPSSDVVNVKVEPKPVEIPNAFSPNGDGIHDVFEIKNIRFFQKAILYIYNQWGELIYKSEPGYTIPWDGKRNGKDVTVSAYYYVLELNMTGFKSLSGDITLIK